ncbi:hypothetical protein MF406_16495 [Georgenia sp. TF02-10]|uniref:hypothetical protein n=1 Tax=Georgenia sp. TF02-10 TaxID=2917725 RepID=UPI001FA70509|nr:hypothetical protein [Georgenia sp. TF02-10]UNX54474.1 hypothetical protein MF406_16495 [Georgenia sp. TF02-10]
MDEDPTAGPPGAPSDPSDAPGPAGAPGLPGTAGPPGGDRAERAVRALRTTLLVCAGTCLALGVLGLALTVLTTGSATRWPGLSLLATGQLLALVAAAGAWAGLRRVLAGAPPAAVTAGVRRLLRVLRTVLVVLLVAGVVGWLVARPSAAVAVVACALVSGQAAVVLHLLQR